MPASFFIADANTSVKTLAYAAFDGGTVYSLKQLANLIRAIKPTANTSDRSLASMRVDWKRDRFGGNGPAPQSGPRGQVKALVHAMLERGDMTADAIAAEVRRQLPLASTTGASVASMKVDWKAAGGTVRGTAVVATAEHLGL